MCEGHKEKEDKKDHPRTYSVRETLDSHPPACYIIYVSERERVRLVIAIAVAVALANASAPMRGEAFGHDDADAAADMLV